MITTQTPVHWKWPDAW